MLFVFEVFLVGGVVYTGVKTFRRQNQRKSVAWLTHFNAPVSEAPDVLAQGKQNTVDVAQIERRINRDFAISSVSLGLSVTGALIYTPLGVASVPFTIYGALPSFENAYESLFSGGRSKTAIISSTVIIGSLIADYNFLASFLQWAYHLNQKLLVELNYAYRQFLLQLFAPSSRSVWVMFDGVEVKIARDELKVGDVVVVNEGEFVPIDGAIVDGFGLVDTYILTGQSRPVEKKPGDKVFAATGLLSGRICVKAEKVR